MEITKEKKMYLRIRNLCGILGVILPWLALLSAGIAEHPSKEWWWSISATYYQSPALVGVLIPACLVLITYVGYDKLDNIFGKTPSEIAITIAEEPGKMPRKMKKAYRSAHRRETKWKRKAENYIKRKTYHAQHATIEVTGNDGQTVSAEMRFDRLNRECDMHGNQTFRMSGKSITVTHTQPHARRGR